MCGKPAAAPKPKPIPQSSAKDAANRGDTGAVLDQPRRVGATESEPGSVLGGNSSGSAAAPVAQSVLGS